MLRFLAGFAFVCMVSFASSAAVTEIKTLAQYTKLYQANKPLVVLYSSPTCKPCKEMKPHFARLSSTYSAIQFATIDTHTKNKPLAAMVQKRDIMSVPNLIGSHKGKDIFEESGWGGKDELARQIKEFKMKTSRK